MVDKKIVIVGGGTAGWLSALLAHRSFPNSKVTVVDSSSVDIIGVGESTTPPIINLFDFLGISISDLVKNCGATIKDSIRFTNWNGDGKFYHHGFDSINPSANIFNYSNLSMFSENKMDWSPSKPLMCIANLYKHQNLDDLHLSGVASIANKIPFSIKNKVDFTEATINHFDRHASIALHFNARLVAEYLKKIGLSRGIEHIDGLVLASELDNNGYVNALRLENDQKINVDFVFDCTGFSRIFVDKTYNSQFKSYSNFLPVKKAIPFFVDLKDKTPPFTEAVSMKNGWLWKIPVEGRFGCGYVFDSDYASDDDAYKEVTKMFGFEPNVPKIISFTPGYFTTPWNKNVLSVGLSSGFIEPLEATSIWITTISLSLFLEHISGFINRDEFSIQEYNDRFIRSTDSILNLVQFHYHNQRNDSLFWKEIRKKIQVSDTLKPIFEIFNNRLPSTTDNYKYYSFPSYSWFIVGAGNQYFDRSVVHKEYFSNNVASIDDQTKFFKKNLEDIVSECIDHDQFLDYLRT